MVEELVMGKEIDEEEEEVEEEEDEAEVVSFRGLRHLLLAGVLGA